jgi:hypothetical protein
LSIASKNGERGEKVEEAISIFHDSFIHNDLELASRGSGVQPDGQIDLLVTVVEETPLHIRVRGIFLRYPP